MRQATFLRRSLLHYWPSNAAVVMGSAVATAALTGALVVGDSMRHSLREQALGRLGRIESALVAPRFFREALAAEIDFDAQATGLPTQIAPAIFLTGGVTHADTRSRVNGITILGVDERFWRMDTVEHRNVGALSDDQWVILNEALAAELGASVGDEVLLRTSNPSPISTETLLGRRDRTAATIRRTVSEVLPSEGLGAFSLYSRQIVSKNAYVPLPALQRALEKDERANAIFVAVLRDVYPSEIDLPIALDSSLRRTLTWADLGIHLRIDVSNGYVAFESESILINPSLESVIEAHRAESGVTFPMSRILAHLANEISLHKGTSRGAQKGTRRSSVPYSTIVAVDEHTLTTLPMAAGNALLGPGDILLNDWAANELGAAVGDSVSVTYYVTGSRGELENLTTDFTLRGIVTIEGPAADPQLVPEYKGVTDTENLADWDPPFPLDLSRIGPRDEAYWDAYRTIPKAFISLDEGQRLWVPDPDRFGRLTALRVLVGSNDTALQKAAEQLRIVAPAAVDARKIGMAFQPVRQNALQASSGSTDFGGLFLGFSFFLIVSAAMLVALLFRLGVERRASELGLLLAGGWAPKTVGRLLVAEGLLFSLIGGALGILAAGGYAWAMLAGLRSWWSAAVHAPFLRLHLIPATLATGLIASVLIAAASAAWSIRGLVRCSPHTLMCGIVSTDLPTNRARMGLNASAAAWIFIMVAALATMGAILNLIAPVMGFFLGGTATLLACLALFRVWLGRPAHSIMMHPGSRAWTRMALRNLPRHRGRSLLTVGLIASASFLIVALEAFRTTEGASSNARDGQNGGFTLFAQSAVPLPFDMNTKRGREELNLDDAEVGTDRAVPVVPFRLRPGDESSCLNLYVPLQPRIIGAPSEMIQRGGFRFSASLAESDDEKANPWTLLNKTLDDDVVPAIADEAAVKWQMHLGLGEDLLITDEYGRRKALRFVALLKNSLLQDEIIVSELNFKNLFPAVEGYAFFLIEAPPLRTAEIESALEKGLERFGFDVRTSAKRLADYDAVQNTYLSTFQTLGGIGLLLGTAGLASVVLRNILERRKELAVLQAVGYARRAIRWIVLAENLCLAVVGLAAGSVSAGLAVAPAVLSDPEALSWSSLGTTLGLVLLTAILSGTIAVMAAVRGSLLYALRSE